MGFLERQERLLGRESTEILSGCRVAVVGIGGVGSAAAEALARCGVGHLLLVDHDVVSESNRNRQLVALCSTLGKSKAEAMAARLRDINPQAEIVAAERCYMPEEREFLFAWAPHFVVDAIDMVTAKLDLIEQAHQRDVSIISVMGTGNKLDPFRFEVADIYETSVCPLCRVVRRELKKRGVDHHKVLYSREEPLRPVEEAEERGRRSVPGSVAFVPPVAGMMAAGEVIKILLKGEEAMRKEEKNG
ncbi:MAG: tRNA threonylcarbamoyladenosine dehydratase [Eubacteriales bacterium]|jgi:tRNA A37 threonylcarbamoyladenosine dehydratase